MADVIARKAASQFMKPVELMVEDMFEIPLYRPAKNRAGESVDVEVSVERVTLAQLEAQKAIIQAKIDAVKSAVA